eukprot:scaffold5509_cov45-Phaeocystis_antarctica.AAC.2
MGCGALLVYGVILITQSNYPSHGPSISTLSACCRPLPCCTHSWVCALARRGDSRFEMASAGGSHAIELEE